jgi:DHA2 family multidrug resistance protein
MLRSLGSSVGISLVQATLVSQSALGFSRLAEHVTAETPGSRLGLPSAGTGDGTVALALLRGQIARQGTMLAYDTIFAWMAVLVCLLVPLVLLLKRPPTQTGSPPTSEALSD